MRIEVFDDNRDNLTAALVDLRALGHQVNVTSDVLDEMKVLNEQGKKIEVFICDLICPPPDKEYWARKGKGKGAYGAMLALYALYARIPNVILVSDQDHHQDPSGELMDWFMNYSSEKKRPDESLDARCRRTWSPVVMGNSRIVVMSHSKSAGNWGAILNSLKTGPAGYPY
jgi:CheY-like chemotaxis protein